MIVYDYLIGKIVGWSCGLDTTLSETEVLSKLTSTALMKYLYIINVLSVDADSQFSLFNLFDNYQAYKHGPVEIDTYYNRNILVRYNMGYKKEENRSYLTMSEKLRNEQIMLFNLQDSDEKQPMQSVLEMLIDNYNLSCFIEMVDDGIEKIKVFNNVPKFTEVDRLIAITHKDTWKAANNRVDKKLNLFNRIKLLEEQKSIIIDLNNM